MILCASQPKQCTSDTEKTLTISEGRKKREIAQFDSLLKTKVQIAVDFSTPRSANLLYIQAVPYM